MSIQPATCSACEAEERGLQTSEPHTRLYGCRYDDLHDWPGVMFDDPGSVPAECIHMRGCSCLTLAHIREVAADEGVRREVARAMLHRWPDDEPITPGDTDQAMRATNAFLDALTGTQDAAEAHHGQETLTP